MAFEFDEGALRPCVSAQPAVDARDRPTTDSSPADPLFPFSSHETLPHSAEACTGARKRLGVGPLAFVILMRPGVVILTRLREILGPVPPYHVPLSPHVSPPVQSFSKEEYNDICIKQFEAAGPRLERHAALMAKYCPGVTVDMLKPKPTRGAAAP